MVPGWSLTEIVQMEKYFMGRKRDVMEKIMHYESAYDTICHLIKKVSKY